MTSNKLKLEALLRKTKTLGHYIFNEKKKCFFGDAAIELYISRVAENKYRSEFYYFDGYEIGLDDKEKELYQANEAAAKKMAIDSFHAQPEIFRGFPIFYTHVSCEIYEEDG